MIQELLRNKEEPTVVSVTRGLDKHWGNAYRRNGLLTALSRPLPLSSSYSQTLLPGFFHCLLEIGYLLPLVFPTHLILTLGFCIIPHIGAMPYIFMMLHSSQGQLEYMISSATCIGRCCPHSADDENEAMGDEVTCPKLRSRGNRGRWWPVPFFPNIVPSLQLDRLSVRYSRVLTCTELGELNDLLIEGDSSLKKGFFLLEVFLEEFQGEFIALKLFLNSREVLF